MVASTTDRKAITRTCKRLAFPPNSSHCQGSEAEYSIPAIRRPQLGRVLRALRKTAGLTLDQVGPDLDMSAGTLKAGNHPVLSVDAVID